MRRTTPPPIAHRSTSSFVAFRWNVENWQPGPLRQMHFQFIDNTKFLVKNQQSLDAMHFEIIFKPMETVIVEQIWYVEAVIQNSFEPQQSVILYSPLVISPQTQEAVLITPIAIADRENFLFENNTLVIDFRFSDEEFSSNGIPPIQGSSVPSVKDPVPFAGLMNLGSTCYMNSLLQAFYYLPAVRHLVYDISKANTVVQELQRLFGGLQVSAKTCSTRLLMKAIASYKGFGWNETSMAVQHEASEFVKVLLGHVKGSNDNDPRVTDLFGGKYISNVRCLNVDFMTANLEDFEDLSLDVRGCSSLDDAFSKFVGPQLLLGENQFETGRLGRQDASVSFEFVHFPPILLLNLRRFEFNPMTGKKEKVNDYMSFPSELDLTRYVQNPSDSYRYELFDVLIHTGSASTGHYMSFIRTTPDDQWYQFNDSSVTEATREQATSQNFGGSSSTNAYMLIYIQKNKIQAVFERVDLPHRIHSLVSEVQVRSPPSAKKRMKTSTNKTVKLLVEADFKQAVLEGYALADLTEIANEVELEENDTNHDLYEKVAANCDKAVNLIRLWKVGPARLPTTVIPENMQKCNTKETILYVQELIEPQVYFQKGMRIAFLSFFFPNATPKVQFIGSMTVITTQFISQVFPFVWSTLGIQGSMFNVFCENHPVRQNLSLADQGITEAAHFVFEAVGPVQTTFLPSYFQQKTDDAISYYSMIRPNGDINAEQYLERRSGQLYVSLYRVSEPTERVTVVSAPEQMAVTDLPALLQFATKEVIDPKKDTLQIFRRRVNSDVNEVIPYVLRSEVTLRNLFVSDLRRANKIQELKLFYDVVRGYTADQLKGMVMRTCDVYDSAVNCVKRIRLPMKEDDHLDTLAAYIRREVLNCGPARFLLDEDGDIREVGPDEHIEEHQLLRFDVIPSEQQRMNDGEFLVKAILCRYSKNQDNSVSLKQSFLFKVVPDEVLDVTRRRLVDQGIADPKLMSYLTVVTSSGRIVNGDECIHSLISDNRTIKVILPDRARTNNILRPPKTISKFQKIVEDISPFP